MNQSTRADFVAARERESNRLYDEWKKKYPQGRFFVKAPDKYSDNQSIGWMNWPRNRRVAGATKRPCTTITFYTYKGKIGRSNWSGDIDKSFDSLSKLLDYAKPRLKEELIEVFLTAYTMKGQNDE